MEGSAARAAAGLENRSRALPAGSTPVPSATRR